MLKGHITALISRYIHLHMASLTFIKWASRMKKSTCMGFTNFHLKSYWDYGFSKHSSAPMSKSASTIAFFGTKKYSNLTIFIIYFYS